MLSIGIDSGANGAAVALDGKGYVEVVSLKKGPRRLTEFMQAHQNAGVVTLERIVIRTGWSIKSMCSLYGSYKACEQAASILLCPVKTVLPRFWQAKFDLIVPKLPGETESKHTTRKKNIHKDKLVELIDGRFSMKITHQVTDAALIAIFGLMREDEW